MSDAYIVRRGKIQSGGGGGNMQSKTVTPTASGFTVTPDSGYDGLSSVIVNGDTDLKVSNIKSGINIFGVTGSYEAAFSKSNAILKVVTSTGCTVAVTGTGYSQTHQDSDGFPRSHDANVTEHFFSIPASAFGTITVTATNVYGTNTKTITVDTAGKVYEVLCAGLNIILNYTFGLKSGWGMHVLAGSYGSATFDQYNLNYKLMGSTYGVTRISLFYEVGVEEHEDIDFSIYDNIKLTYVASNISYPYPSFSLVGADSQSYSNTEITNQSEKTTITLTPPDKLKNPYKVIVYFPGSSLVEISEIIFT